MRSTSIFNQRINSTTLIEVAEIIRNSLNGRRKILVFAMNVHILLLLRKDRRFKKQHDKADVVFCDGVPLTWLAKALSGYDLERVSGTDIAEMVLSKFSRAFLLGSTSEVLKRMKRNYGDSVCGYYSPPFENRWNKKVTKEIISTVNKSKAKILLVGVGPLKQEQWILENVDKLRYVKVFIGVGSALDILSGKTPRAPIILKNNGFEWMWRILLEPKRLFFRYLLDFMYLGLLLVDHVRKQLF